MDIFTFIMETALSFRTSELHINVQVMEVLTMHRNPKYYRPFTERQILKRESLNLFGQLPTNNANATSQQSLSINYYLLFIFLLFSYQNP